MRGKPAVKDDGEHLSIESPSFDPAKPQTWGFTQLERRVDALAVHDGRLFYSVAEGPEIWSVGLEPDGNFKTDVRFEAGIESEKPFPVASIVFDSNGNMIVAQRAPLQNPADYARFVEAGPSQVLRLKPETPDDPETPGLWLQSDPQEYAAGEEKDFRSASGGAAIQYAYRDDGTMDTSSCGGTLVFSTDAIGPQLAGHGLQFSQIGTVRPANTPPKESAFIDLSPQLDDAAARGYAGGVAALQVCGGDGFPPVAFGAEGGGGFPLVAGGGGAFPPVEGGGGPGLAPLDNTAPGGSGTPQFPPVVDESGDQGGGGTTQSGPLSMIKEPASATCAENQSCSFKVTITNTSDQPVPAPTISDDMSIGDVPFSKFKLGALDASWTCVAAAAPGMQCTHADPIPANTSIDLTLAFTPEPGALKGASELKNCASFAGAAPVAGGPAANNAPKANLPPPPAPTGTNNGGLKVQMTPVNGVCSPTKGDCEFNVTITNNTGAPIDKQPLTISSTLAVGTQTQAKNDPTTPQLPAGLACKPDGRELACTDNALTLAPGQSTSFTVAYSIDTSEGGPANFVQNKTLVTLGPLTGEATAAVAFNEPVNVLPEPAGPQAQNVPGGDAAAAPACAVLPVVPSGPITVTKTGPAKCAPKGECTFNISVTNSSDAAIDRPIAI